MRQKIDKIIAENDHKYGSSNRKITYIRDKSFTVEHPLYHYKSYSVVIEYPEGRKFTINKNLAINERESFEQCPICCGYMKDDNLKVKSFFIFPYIVKDNEDY